MKGIVYIWWSFQLEDCAGLRPSDLPCFVRYLSISAGLAIAASCAVVLLLRLSIVGRDRGIEVTGDPLDIRLVAIRPDSGDEIFAPNGESLGKRHFGTQYLERWENVKANREFFFDIPETTGPIQFPTRASIRESGTGKGLGGATPVLRPAEDGKKQVVVPAVFLQEYRKRIITFGIQFIDRYIPTVKKRVRDVDITLRFYSGPNGPAALRFTGPFSEEHPVSDDAKGGCTMTVKMESRGRRTQSVSINVDSPQQLDADSICVLYKDDGSWFSCHLEGPYGEPDFKFEYRIPWSHPLSQISAVTIGEKVRDRTFHNVPIVFPHWPERDHAPYLDAVDERLHRDSAIPLDWGTLSGTEALEVLDLARGWSLNQAWDAIRSGKKPLEPDELTSDQLARLRETATECVNSMDPPASAQGFETDVPFQAPIIRGP